MSNGEGGMSTTAPEYVEESLLRGPGAKVISSFCSADKPQCVEVEFDEGNAYAPIVVTDSKESEPLVSRGQLRFTRTEWGTFVAGVKNGEFDLDVLVDVANAAAEAGRSGRVTAGEVVVHTA